MTEIHAPERHIQSFRDVAIHLAIVTAGILIALSLEQAVEWFHHRELVKEATELMRQEIRDNQKALEQQAVQLRKDREGALSALDFITGLLQKIPGPDGIDIDFNPVQLRNTSWATAQAAGALAYMPYAELNRYAATYRTQEDYLETQKRAEDAVTGAYDVFIKRQGKLQFQKLSPAELEAERARMMYCVSALDIQLLKMEPLRKQYAETLKQE